MEQSILMLVYAKKGEVHHYRNPCHKVPPILKFLKTHSSESFHRNGSKFQHLKVNFLNNVLLKAEFYTCSTF